VEPPVENETLVALSSGLDSLGLALDGDQLDRLIRFQELLLAWNRKLNLTSITDPIEAVDKHLLDSLLAQFALTSAGTVMDIGAGGGLPALPLAIANPAVDFTLVDSVAKKVGFLKAAIATLSIPNARAIHARARGRPQNEGLPRVDALVSRAALPPASLLDLATAYLNMRGRAILFLGGSGELPMHPPKGMHMEEQRKVRLPLSGAWRQIAVFRWQPERLAPD
jgi:16S rRNA (guanine527-N7)-methyltransferase